MDRHELGRRHDRIMIVVSVALIVAKFVFLIVIVSRLIAAA